MKIIKLTLCLVMVMMAFTGCAEKSPETTESMTEDVEVTPSPTETSEKEETTATVLAESEAETAEQTEYFDVDYAKAEQMASYTPEFVLEGFYDTFINCIPYIVEIEIKQSPYSAYGDVVCRVEGISKLQLKNIIEDGFGISMRVSTFGDGGYDGMLDEDIYEVNKISITAYHGNVYLEMQEADFSAVDSFKLPEYYINQLGENAFNLYPKDSILINQIVNISFAKDTFSFYNVYSVPYKNRQAIVDDYIDTLSKIEGYSYEYIEEWNQHFYNIRKSDEITIINEKNEYEGNLEIYSTVQYKKPLVLDSQAFEQTHSLEFEDLYNNTATKVVPIVDGDIIAASIAENPEFTLYAIMDLMEFADVLGDVAELSVKDAVVTKLFYGGYYDVDHQLNEIVPVDDIINAIGGDLVHADRHNLVMYKENEYFLHARVEEVFDYWISEEPCLAYTLVDIGSSDYGNIEQLKLIERIPILNIDEKNEPLNTRLELKRDNEQYLFRFSKFYILDANDANAFDETSNMYEEYIMSQTDDCDGWGNDESKNWEYLVESEVYADIAYATQGFIGMPGDDVVFVNVSVGEFAKDWED